MKYEPLVSILMNCYNGEKYLKEAVDSILAQTYQNWEIILWDNQSTDRSAEIYKDFNDPRLKYFYAPEHTDLGGGRAKAWGHITGEFVAVLDVDDLWHPKKLEKQIPLFDDPDVGIAISDSMYFNGYAEKPHFGENYPPTGWVFEQLFTSYYVSLETLVFRKSIADKLPIAFDPDFNAIADFDLVVRLSLLSKLAYYPEILAKWRVHKESDTWKYPQYFMNEKEKWLVKQLKVKTFSECKYSSTIQKFRNKNTRSNVIIQLIDNKRILAFKTLMQSGFDHWHAWVLLAFCFLPFSRIIISYVFKRRLELS